MQKPSPFPPLVAWTRATGASLALIVSLFGCSDTTEIAAPCADCPFVVIEGTVSGPPGVLPAEVQAQATHGLGPGTVRATAATDSSGAYRLLVTPGSYRLSVATAVGARNEQHFVATPAGPTALYDPADSLVIRSSDLPHHIDLRFGALLARLAIPAAVRGETVSASLYPVGSNARLWAASVAVRDSVQIDLGAVPAGAYFVALEWGGSHLWWPAAGTRAGAGVAQVTSGQRSSITGEIPIPGKLKGRVLGSWQSMEWISPPIISAFDADSSTALATTRAAEDGSYAIEILASMEARVRVGFEGRTRWLGGTSYRTAQRIEAGPNQTTEAPDFIESGLRIHLVLPEPPTSGTVSPEAAIAGANRRILFRAHGSLGPDEWLEIPNMVAGTYYVHLHPGRPYSEDWIGEWFDGVELLADATPVVIPTEGETRELTFHPKRGGRIPVRIRDTEGRIVRYLSLAIIDMATPNRTEGFRIDANEEGVGLIRGLHTSSYKVAYATSSTKLDWYPGTNRSAEATPIPTVDGEDAPLVEWSLLP